MAGNIPWYELPIEVQPSSSGSQWVDNGREGKSGWRGYYPERHYWPDEESQRRDSRELLVIAATRIITHGIARLFDIPVELMTAKDERPIWHR